MDEVNKICNLPNGRLVQVSTQQRNQDGSYAVAEALTFVPDENKELNLISCTSEEVDCNENDPLVYY